MMKFREQLITIKKWETATRIFIFGVQIMELEKSEIDNKTTVLVEISSLLTKYLNWQFDDVDGTLNPVAEDEDSNNDNEGGWNHKVPSLSFIHCT